MAPSDADLRTNISKVLGAGNAPMTLAAIAQALPVGGRPTPVALNSLLQLMVNDGSVVHVTGKTDAYAMPLPTADPLALLSSQLDQLIAGFVARGQPREAVAAAARRHLGVRDPAQPPPTVSSSGASGGLPAETLIAAMHRLEPRVNEGAAVSIARLREALTPGCDKTTFDAALLALLARGVVELQSHAWPARLTAEEKSLLIDNRQGGWFDSAALLRRPS
jgi:hypothetical protein